MKNVLLIGSELGKGGAERSISLLSYYLEQKQYNVILCILSGKDREQYYKTCKNIVFIDPPEHTSIIGKIKAWRYRLKRIKQIKKEHHIDVSISFLEGPDYVNVLTKQKEKIVISIRGSKTNDKEINGIKGIIRKKALIPFLYNKANKIVCVTDALSNELHTHFGIPDSKLKTIYNFYETDEIKRLSTDPLSENESKIFKRPVIITCGRLHIAKEQDKLIRIFSKVHKGTNSRLLLLGDGELRQSHIQLCKDLELKVCEWNSSQFEDADVYFMGFQKNAFKFYKHSRLFALTSSWEGFPNVLAEALLCNTPVVSTDCHSGPREILNVNGLGIEPTTTPVEIAVGSLLPMLDTINEERFAVWAKAIEYWLTKPSPDEHYFTMLTNRFTLEAMLQQWADVIDN
jgi:glycosyltransferase involved in cell wall biosynthesis